MRRHGIVARTNSGIVKIKTTDDGYTVIELLCAHSPVIGDKIAWNNGYERGRRTYENLTSQVHFEVFVQRHGVS